jgi:hypothetical protein
MKRNVSGDNLGLAMKERLIRCIQEENDNVCPKTIEIDDINFYYFNHTVMDLLALRAKAIYAQDWARVENLNK